MRIEFGPDLRCLFDTLPAKKTLSSKHKTAKTLGITNVSSYPECLVLYSLNGYFWVSYYLNTFYQINVL